MARFFFSNGNVTINLLPILTFTFFAALLAVPLLLPAYDALSGLYSNAYSNSVAYSGSTYGQPASGFGYSARSSLVRCNSHNYSKHFIDILQVELSDEQKALYPEITELRAKIEKLQEDEFNIRSQIYYGTYDTTNPNNLGQTQPYSY